MKDPVQEAFEACYEDVAGGVPMSPELERSMVFWVEKQDRRYCLLLFGWPGCVIRGGVFDNDTHLVIRHDGGRVPLHIFLFATALPLLAIFCAGESDGT